MTFLTRTIGAIVLAATAAFAAPIAPAAAQEAAPAQPAAGVQAPRIPVATLDRAALIRDSASGKAIASQLETLSQGVRKELETEETAIRTEAQQLQAQAAVLSADARNKRQADLRKRQEALQRKAAIKEREIQLGLARARQQIEQAASPILQSLMTERQLILVIDRSAVVIGAMELDVTQLVIERLNAALPTVTLTPVKVDENGQPVAAAEGQ